MKLAIFVVGFLTTFHGATRTSVPFILMLYSLIEIKSNKLENQNNSIIQD